MLEVDINNILPVTEARNSFNEIINKVEGSNSMYVLTKNGKPSAVVVGVNHLEKLTGKNADELTSIVEKKADNLPTGGEGTPVVEELPNQPATNIGVSATNTAPPTDIVDTVGSKPTMPSAMPTSSEVAGQSIQSDAAEAPLPQVEVPSGGVSPQVAIPEPGEIAAPPTEVNATANAAMPPAFNAAENTAPQTNVENAAVDTAPTSSPGGIATEPAVNLENSPVTSNQAPVSPNPPTGGAATENAAGPASDSDLFV